MKHEEFRELMALQLYGELDAAELERLRAHVAACADCAAYEHELGAGLGTVMAAAAERDDGALPEDWQERLNETTAPRRRAVGGALLTFAAGLAAGLLVMTFNPNAPDPVDVTPEVATSGFATNRPDDALPEIPSGPPPPATGRGKYGMLALALRSQ